MTKGGGNRQRRKVIPRRFSRLVSLGKETKDKAYATSIITFGNAKAQKGGKKSSKRQRKR